MIDPKSKMWLIWSNEHEAWWRPDGGGYSSDVGDAGRYALADAVKICEAAGSLNRRGRRNGAVPAEIIGPSPELIAALNTEPK